MSAMRARWFYACKYTWLLTKCENQVAEIMKLVAVIKVTISVKKQSLWLVPGLWWTLYRMFSTWVQSKAETLISSSVIACKCGNQIYF